MKISVLGCGRWGSFLAWYHSRNNQVTLWGRPDSRAFASLCATHTNEYVTLPPEIVLTSDLGAALAAADMIVISISAQQLRSFAKQINAFCVTDKTFILCMKGLEEDTGKRLSVVFEEEVTQHVHVAVWVGPGHVQDFTREIPNCMVVDAKDAHVVDEIVDTLSSDLIRLYKGHDIIGTEVGAAAKNVIGIAAGMLDGKQLTCLKGSLMARGAREISRLMKAMGANELSAYGLCHLGDYEATLFSQHSHNRKFGEMYIKGEAYTALAEGVATTKALVKLGEAYQVDLPICKAIDMILYENKNADIVLKQLFSRSVKGEFDS
ncbi:MAG: NAD(P)H-dependent glycerol-3-phosphate dehydrogenase [Ruthenibacterium sp.]